MATSHVVDGATEHRLLRPAAPMEVSAELLGHSGPRRKARVDSCKRQVGAFDGREREEGDDRPVAGVRGARPVAADVAGLPGSTRREPILLGLEFCEH
jgi:hypothetical protein